MTPATAIPHIPYDKLKSRLEDISDVPSLLTAIANAPFEYKVEMAFLFLGFISFYLVDPNLKAVRIASSSDTEHYHMAVDGYDADMASFQVPLDQRSNSIVKAIMSGEPQETADWATLSRPKIPPKFPRANQASSGIAYSCVYPLDVSAGGAMLFAFYREPREISTAEHQFMKKYAALVSSVLTDKLR